MQTLQPVPMKYFPLNFPHLKFLPALLLAAAGVAAPAQTLSGASGALSAPSTPSAPSSSRIYRCGNAYTNDPVEAQAKGCKLLDGGNITVVQGTRVQAPRASGPGTGAVGGAPAGAGPRVDGAEQRARDADARYILESELKKAEARRAELAKEYNNGEPEKMGAETRNHQKYLDRVAELKAAIARNEADIAGIQRELSRLSASK